MVSILIPTIRNLEYLKVFCDSLKRHTEVPYEVLIWNNEADPETKEYCNSIDCLYFESKENRGITKPYNVMVEKSKYDLVFLADNDYYALPGWDGIVKYDSEVYWKRPTLIDPREYMHTKSIVRNFGHNLQQFREEMLLRNFANKEAPEIVAAYMPPVMKKQDYIEIGGFNEDFFVAETDFVWRAFCYYQKHGFEQKISGNSFIYHFGSVTYPRPFTFEEENQKHMDYLLDTYDKTEQELCDIMGIK